MSMSKEILLKDIVSTVSNEKGVSVDDIFEALEVALISATKKKYGANIGVRIDINRKTGIYHTFRVWNVVEKEPLEDPLTQIPLEVACLDDPSINVGDQITEPMESVNFGRIAVQNAKQVIIQKVREAERSLIAREYNKRVDEIMTSIVKKATRESLLLEVSSSAEGIIKKNELLPREIFRPGDKIKAYLKEVSNEPKGPQLVFSRTCNEMLIELFKIEVPEVGEGIIQIKNAAREPGYRAKIAVKTNDGRLDPVGACVGIRGARVQAVSNELNGERVDIILWAEDPAQFVMNAMSPAEIISIVVDDDTHTMDLAVAEEYLSQAIGKNGQNVKLASQLTGWELNVITASEAKERDIQETDRLRDLFIEELDVDEKIANILILEDFTTLEEIAYVPIQEMLEIEEFDEEIVNTLRERAQEQVLKREQDKYKYERQNGALDLAKINGMNNEFIKKLSENNIFTREDLANLAADDLVDILGLNIEQAGKLIMMAREHWFSEKSKLENIITRSE